ncbi:MAG: ATP-binding protein [Betaproteobacteria bacterium]|nr:ATP-binding protein [Betaproteobacteria bacterium]
MTSKAEARNTIEALRKGIPPRHGVERYAVGNEKLLAGIERMLEEDIADTGLIRFINGSWGAGKTHFFRQLCSLSYRKGCLVSNVELGKDGAVLNKFESIFTAIIRAITSKADYVAGEDTDLFGGVLKEALFALGGITGTDGETVPPDAVKTAKDKLMQCRGIDIDFKKMVAKYWETHLADCDMSDKEQMLGEILQWFTGEAGNTAAYRKKFDINKCVKRENARELLRSLAVFIRLSGYRGLVILFDEAEASYSAMRKTALREAHNNLLHLINIIGELNGLFLIYATTPDFFNDAKHGIDAYGALAGRIGKPEDLPPRMFQRVWNLDAVKTDLSDYQAAAVKVRDIYLDAYPEAGGIRLASSAIEQRVRELNENHSDHAECSFWRVAVQGVIRLLDNHAESVAIKPAPEEYQDIMESLRE